MKRWEEIYEFWFGDLDDSGAWGDEQEKLWFRGAGEADEIIRARFLEDIERAAAGAYDDWTDSPTSAVALIILLDQFPRNVYRHTAEAFAQDEKARSITLVLIDEGLDEEMLPIERLFVYMPLEHAENLVLQERCVELMRGLVQDAPPSQREAFEAFVDYAERHHAIIEEFGRFPHRNETLGRHATPAEVAYLRDGGETFGQSASHEEE